MQTPKLETNASVAVELSTFRITVLVLIIATIGFFASDSYLPALPAITAHFHSTAAIIQSTITSYLLGFALAQLIYGPVADRFGRRPMILAGLTVAMLGSIACILAPSAEFLIIARFFQGAGVAAGAALFRTILRDVFSGVKLAEAIATISTFFALVPAIAPVIGAHLQSWFGWQANFVFIAIYIICTWFIVFYGLPETNRYLDPQATRISQVSSNYRTLLSSKIFMGHVLCSGLAFAIVISYAIISPFLFQKVMHLSPVLYGWLSIYMATGLFLGKILNKYLLKKLNFLKIMLLGFLLNLTSGLVMLIFAGFEVVTVTAVMLPVTVCIVGCGLILSNAAAGAFIPFPKIAGTAGGLYGCLQVLAAFITGQVMTLFEVHNQIPLAIAIVVINIAGLLCYFSLVTRE